MKKFLSMVLTIILTFSVMTTSTYSMVNGESSANRRSPIPQTAETNLYNVKKLPFVFLVTGITAIGSILSGLLGYKIGNDRRVSDEKEITLVGSLGHTILGGIHKGVKTVYLDKLLSKFIDKLFSEDIPKLYRQNEFPATYMASLEFYLSALSDRLNNEELSYKYRKVAEELVTMSQVIGEYVDEPNKKISLGYLKELLKDTKSLLQKATDTIEEMELEKEQNKPEL